MNKFQQKPLNELESLYESLKVSYFKASHEKALTPLMEKLLTRLEALGAFIDTKGKQNEL